MVEESIYISPGNRRMKIPTFSLPSGSTCINATKHCKKYCYAKKAEISYPNVLPSRERNYRISQTNDFIRQVSRFLAKKKPKYFRIHESGDFYSQEYFEKWLSIATLFPNTIFLVYTQVYNLEFDDLPNNFVLYYSIWDDTKMKDVPKNGRYAYVYDSTNKKVKYTKLVDILLSNVTQCKKESDPDVTCDTCLWCYNVRKDIKFQIH